MLFLYSHRLQRDTGFLSPSLFPVSAGTGRDALCWTAALATALAVTVKAVCGTSRGISGTKRRPSIDHSEELFGPDILNRNAHSVSILLCFQYTQYSYLSTLFQQWKSKRLILNTSRAYCSSYYYYLIIISWKPFTFFSLDVEILPQKI